MHPFRSAAVALRYLAGKGWWKPTSSTSLTGLCELIHNAVLEEVKKKSTQEIHDNSKLPAIYTSAEEAGVMADEDIDLLFRLILLHQSFAVVAKHPA